MNIHVYRAKDQPATRYRVSLTMPNGRENGTTIRQPARRLLPCFKCRTKHRAENMIAHVYYDGVYFFCKPWKGCKS